MKRLIRRRMTANRSLTHIFDEEIVTRHPDKVALIDIENGSTFTFRQVQLHTRRIANYFKVIF
jgi:hypothetical protein